MDLVAGGEGVEGFMIRCSVIWTATFGAVMVRIASLLLIDSAGEEALNHCDGETISFGCDGWSFAGGRGQVSDRICSNVEFKWPLSVESSQQEKISFPPIRYGVTH